MGSAHGFRSRTAHPKPHRAYPVNISDPTDKGPELGFTKQWHETTWNKLAGDIQALCCLTEPPSERPHQLLCPMCASQLRPDSGVERTPRSLGGSSQPARWSQSPPHPLTLLSTSTPLPSLWIPTSPPFFWLSAGAGGARLSLRAFATSYPKSALLSLAVSSAWNWSLPDSQAADPSPCPAPQWHLLKEPSLLSRSLCHPSGYFLHGVYHSLSLQ